MAIVLFELRFGFHAGYYCCCYCLNAGAVCRAASALARRLRTKKPADDAVSHASVASVDFDVGTFASTSAVSALSVPGSASVPAVADAPRSPKTDRKGRRGRRSKARFVAVAAAPAPAAADDASVASELTVETSSSFATHGSAISLRSARPPAEGPAAPEKPGFLARARRLFRKA